VVDTSYVIYPAKSSTSTMIEMNVCFIIVLVYQMRTYMGVCNHQVLKVHYTDV
jgi:hypothetical protein